MVHVPTNVAGPGTIPNGRREHKRDVITFLIFKFAAILVPALPRTVLYKLAIWMGDLSFFISRKSRRNLIGNLSRVLGKTASTSELNAIARQGFRTQALNYMDLFSIPHLPPKFWTEKVKIVDREYFDEARDGGRGVILISAHVGNLDMLVQTAAMIGVQVSVIIEPLHPPILLDLVTGLRASRGVTFMPVSTRAIMTVAKTLRRGGVLAMACDKNIQDRGISVPFFGENARLPTGAVELAMMTGSAVMPVSGTRLKNDCYTITLGPVIELIENGENVVERNMERLVSVMEAQISLHPEQWVVFEPVWEDARAPRTSPKSKPVASNRLEARQR
ncbi:MAG: hypothetical protein EXR50_04570 [Dehalococcoidia bacterium]|nr:hypothetical protein [Dehalococcoidia bacterium]